MEENFKEADDDEETKKISEEKLFDFSKIGRFMKKNPWMITSIILVLVLAFFLVKPIPTGNAISENDIGDKALNFANTKLFTTPVTLNSVEETSGIYQINVNSGGKVVPLYFTKDGNFIYPGTTLMSIMGDVAATSDTQQQEPADVPKSDKPVVETFVFSYCPYGLQFEKALLPVYRILKDKADIELVAIGAMHGEYEKIETLRQICIQENYGKDKLWDYLEKFMGDTAIGNCENNMDCSKPLIEALIVQLGMDKDKINSCMDTDAEVIYQEQNARASELGQSGSPGFVINGVDVSVARNPEAIKTAICSAFNTEPEECSETLSSESSSAGFGYSASASASSSQC